jgi:hypothetical protein
MSMRNRLANEIKAILVVEGVADMPVGIDFVELPMIFGLHRLGIEVRDGQQTMIAFAGEMEAFGLEFAHGPGLGRVQRCLRVRC